MIGKVVYDGKPLSDFRIDALCENPYDIALPNITTIHVTGMNGDIHFYSDEYSNLELKYICEVNGGYEEYSKYFNAFKAWLFTKQGYKRLEDDKYPDHYRMAIVESMPTTASVRNVFEIIFNCKPQKFLKSGDLEQEMLSSGSIYNPTEYESKPIIRVTGTGALTIGNTTITINKNDQYIDLDCELQDASMGITNCNSYIELTSGDFFTLAPGTNRITLSSGMNITITPRWFTL